MVAGHSLVDETLVLGQPYDGKNRSSVRPHRSVYSFRRIPCQRRLTTGRGQQFTRIYVPVVAAHTKCLASFVPVLQASTLPSVHKSTTSFRSSVRVVRDDVTSAPVRIRSRSGRRRNEAIKKNSRAGRDARI